MMGAGSVLRTLERFLMPNACVACERPVDESAPDALVCSRCRWRMRAVVGGGGCSRCAQPLPLIGPCRFCKELPAALRWVRSAVWLDDEAREVVHHLKYEGFSALAPFAAALISRNVARPDSGTLVPVPMAGPRERRRGYNQAALLAQALGVAWKLPLEPGLLARVGAADSQTALTPQARRANVAGAFAAIMPGRAAVAPVIIVDDVLTTGATIHAAAEALESAGWTDIGAVTFARALPVERRAQ